MSAHYSRYLLNTYSQTPYFRAHLPKDYPLDRVLIACRAFRRLPPNLRELAALAKRWALRIYQPDEGGVDGIDRWYDADGHELSPASGERLTGAEIDADWPPHGRGDDFEAKDIPVPAGGFAAPETWQAPLPAEEPEAEERPTREQLIRDVASHGRERTAQEYGIPVEQLPSPAEGPTWGDGADAADVA